MRNLDDLSARKRKSSRSKKRGRNNLKSLGFERIWNRSGSVELAGSLKQTRPLPMPFRKQPKQDRTNTNRPRVLFLYH